LNGTVRARMVVFRLLAGLLVLFSLAGVLAFGIGVYLTVLDAGHIGWIPALFLCVLGVTMVLMVAASVRAIKIRSLRELEEQSRYPTLEKLVTWFRT
jgi:hypothetical protein